MVLCEAQEQVAQVMMKNVHVSIHPHIHMTLYPICTLITWGQDRGQDKLAWRQDGPRWATTTFKTCTQDVTKKNQIGDMLTNIDTGKIGSHSSIHKCAC